MPAIAAAYAAVAVAAAVLVFGTYYRGGMDALRQNARQIGLLVVAVIVLVVLLALVTSTFAR